MAAVWIAAGSPHGPHRLRLPAPTSSGSALELVSQALAHPPGQGPVVLEALHWPLTLTDLRPIKRRLEAAGLALQGICSQDRPTLVAAAALGISGEWTQGGRATTTARDPRQDEGAFTLHRGTLRSGEHLQADGSVLVLGDVNPGARVSAAGHVLVWGRLRGLAHAGCRGDGEARIVALQLHPLQLRIAEVVARGPEGRPPLGLAEQALLRQGVIQIEPAPPQWPQELGRGLSG